MTAGTLRAIRRAAATLYPDLIWSGELWDDDDAIVERFEAWKAERAKTSESGAAAGGASRAPEPCASSRPAEAPKEPGFDPYPRKCIHCDARAAIDPHRDGCPEQWKGIDRREPRPEPSRPDPQHSMSPGAIRGPMGRR